MQHLVTAESWKVTSSDEHTNNGQYFHVAAVTRQSLPVKLKSDENSHALKVVSRTLYCFVGMFLHFFENANYAMFHQHSSSIQESISKMKTGIIFYVIFHGSTNRSNH